MSPQRTYSDPSALLEKVKLAADQVIKTRLETGKSVTMSTRITTELDQDYNTVNQILLSEFGLSVKSIFQSRVVEKAKELLVYTEHSLTRIAGDLGYKNASYLSGQIKKITGCTPSYFKKVRKSKLEIMKRRPGEEKM
ncbi:hypothetical protein GCM10023091_04030 [Ravibacter arvi]|uniref:HTH araC/xylS-type domain-containing protein n=2 Tax=Ravibacter arvi TaxID=2051041 RepID=A0ABP8LNJ1_9BACT